MATFIRFLKKKSNKDHPELAREKPGRSSARGRPTFAQSESNEWATKSPYDVVTAPKTTKTTRSCPGAPVGHVSGRGTSSKRQPPSQAFGASRQSSFSERYENVPALEEITNSRPSRRRPGSSSEYGSMRPYVPHARYEPTLQSTSEYGSADPSPTNPYGCAESSDSEYDSDVVPSHMLRYYDKQIHKLRAKCRYYKDLAIRYKTGYEEEHHTAQQLNRRLDKEAEARRRLSSELKQLRTENEHLKTALTGKYPFQMPELQIGAGEAMCSRSDLRSAIHHNELPMMAPLSLNFDNDGESDEVKCFRTKEEDSLLEQPRCAPVSQTMFSPDSLLRGTAGSLKDAILAKTDDDGYSTMNLQGGQVTTLSEAVPCSNRAESLEEGTEVVHLGASLADAAAEQHVYKETHFDDNVGIRDLRGHNSSPVDEEATDELPSPRSLRRSFSDSDIRNLEVIEPQEASPGAPKPNRDWADPAHYFPFSKKRRSRAYSKRGDNSSSFSSDDENVRMVSRQLRKRGDLVQFRPPRKSVAVMKSNIYRRFGPNERSALSQFEYLQEMTTDVSGLLSSPDRSPGSF